MVTAFRFAVVVVLASSCGDPLDREIRQIDTCPLFPSADCCETDAGCAAYYGDAFPYCLDPGAASGVCHQCRTGGDCASGICDQTTDGAGLCRE